jgi:hypothetical protein
MLKVGDVYSLSDTAVIISKEKPLKGFWLKHYDPFFVWKELPLTEADELYIKRYWNKIC